MNPARRFTATPRAGALDRRGGQCRQPERGEDGEPDCEDQRRAEQRQRPAAEAERGQAEAGEAGAEPTFGREEDQHDRGGDGGCRHGERKARVAERRGEQPDDEGEAERDGVELEGVACAPVRAGSGDGVSHDGSWAGWPALAPTLRLRRVERITNSVAVRASRAGALGGLRVCGPGHSTGGSKGDASCRKPRHGAARPAGGTSPPPSVRVAGRLRSTGAT